MNISEEAVPLQARSARAERARQILGLTLESVHLACGHISYVDEGSGATIVLLHGAPFTGLGFVRVIRELRRHYRVIAPDLPGFGYSRASPGFDGSLASYADMVVEFCTALRLENFYFYLNDSSGCFGLKAAAHLAPDVAGLVIADTVRLPLTGSAWIVKQALKRVVSSRLLRFLNRRFNLFPWLVATVAPWLRPFPKDERAVLTAQFDTPEKRDRVIDMFSNMGRDETFVRSAADLARQYLAQKPTLLLYGQFDPMRFVSLDSFKSLFRNSTVKIIPHEEHFPILSSGEQVGQAVHDWMAATLRERGADAGLS
jgi:haloalkane dehalogenase